MYACMYVMYARSHFGSSFFIGARETRLAEPAHAAGMARRTTRLDEVAAAAAEGGPERLRTAAGAEGGTERSRTASFTRTTARRAAQRAARDAAEGRLHAALKRVLDLEEELAAWKTAHGDSELAARLAVAAPAVSRELAGLPTAALDRSRRNAALHCPGAHAAQIATAGRAELNRLQRGDRTAAGAHAAEPASDEHHARGTLLKDEPPDLARRLHSLEGQLRDQARLLDDLTEHLQAPPRIWAGEASQLNSEETAHTRLEEQLAAKAEQLAKHTRQLDEAHRTLQGADARLTELEHQRGRDARALRAQTAACERCEEALRAAQAGEAERRGQDLEARTSLGE